jgi:protein-tyrosine phosphatase
MGYTDLHAHVLPGLDDGPADEETCLALLRTLAGMGYELVTATPHQKAAQYLPTHEAIATVYARVAAAAPVRMALAAENFWDDVFFQRWREGAIPGYEGGPAFLFEIPHGEAPARFEETLFEMRLGGRMPVLAHPERYRPFWDDFDRLARLARQVVLVVDLGAVAGYHGVNERKMAQRLLRERVAHAAATDVHALGDARVAGEGLSWIRKRLGAEAVTRLLTDNPRRVLSGEFPDP